MANAKPDKAQFKRGDAGKTEPGNGQPLPEGEAQQLNAQTQGAPNRQSPPIPPEIQAKIEQAHAAGAQAMQQATPQEAPQPAQAPTQGSPQGPPGPPAQIPGPTNENDQMLYGPTMFPEEHVTQGNYGYAPGSVPPPPSDIGTWFPMLVQAAQDPHAPQQLKDIVRLASTFIDKHNRGQ